MMATKKDEPLDICLICGDTIPKRVGVFNHDIFSFMVEKIDITACLPCAWAAFERQWTSTKQPFKEPQIRGRANNSPPQQFLDYIESTVEKKDESG